MSAPMVLASLAGTKTQTRRLVVPQPQRGTPAFGPLHVGPDVENDPTPFLVWQDDPQSYFKVRCPYGVAGDRLWLREGWRTGVSLDNLNATEIATKCADAGYTKPWAPLLFTADDYTRDANTLRDFGNDWGRPRLARFMPRWASRLTLEVTDVRVQRLQDISEEDAKAEGVEPWDALSRDQVIPGPGFDGALYRDNLHRLPFSDLWDSINAKRAPWDSNPWVWALTFRRAA
jgi:hypothetical protein